MLQPWRFFIVCASWLFCAGLLALDPGLAIVIKNDFETKRSLRQYDELCGKKLIPHLNELSARASQGTISILDSGCGDARALREMARRFKGMRFTGISYQVDESERNELAKYPIEIITGLFIEEIPTGEFLARAPKFDLIIDIFGPYSYSPNPVAVLKKYFAMLSSNGTIYIGAVNAGRLLERERGLMVMVDGFFIPLHRWLIDNTSNLSLEVGEVKGFHEYLILKASDPKKPILIKGDLGLNKTYDFLCPPARDWQPIEAKSRL